MLTEEPLHSRIVALAIGETHCVFKWGSDFRPTYARIHELRALVPSDTPMLAATATVTKICLPIILQQLNIVDYKLAYVYIYRQRGLIFTLKFVIVLLLKKTLPLFYLI